MNQPRRIEYLIQEKIKLISERCKLAEEICKSTVLKPKPELKDQKHEKVKR